MRFIVDKQYFTYHNQHKPPVFKAVVQSIIVQVKILWLILHHTVHYCNDAEELPF
jgi:hypothetical protein